MNNLKKNRDWEKFLKVDICKRILKLKQDYYINDSLVSRALASSYSGIFPDVVNTNALLYGDAVKISLCKLHLLYNAYEDLATIVYCSRLSFSKGIESNEFKNINISDVYKVYNLTDWHVKYVMGELDIFPKRFKSSTRTIYTKNHETKNKAIIALNLLKDGLDCRFKK